MQRFLYVSLLSGLVGLGWVPGVGAQTAIVPDTTLPAGLSLVTTNGLRDEIRGGVVSGPNLFHSFSGFGVAEGRAAYFVPGSGVETILTRVTGGQGSSILGTLGVVGDASLFLLNPNGIVFGPSSKLDVAGSFVGTTATSFEFGGGLSFGAVNSGGAPVLTTSVSPGLQLGAMGAGAISTQGNLRAGGDLRLVSRSLNLQGWLDSGRNLTLQGTDTVTAQDSATVPFIARAAENLLVQGDQYTFITTTAPISGLYSGGNMILRAKNYTEANTQLWSGGELRVESVNGGIGGLYSPKGLVIRTGNGVNLASYYVGASLHVLTGGGFKVGDQVRIQGPSDGTNYLIERITLSDGSTLNINGENQGGINEGIADIRTGSLAWSTNQIGDRRLIIPSISSNIAASRNASIEIQNSVNFRNIFRPENQDTTSGTTFLTNQYHPNPDIIYRDIQVKKINEPRRINTGFFSLNDQLDRGQVFIDSSGNIDSQDISGSLATLISGDSIAVSGVMSAADKISAYGNINIDTIKDSPVTIDSTRGDIQIGTIDNSRQFITIRTSPWAPSIGIYDTSSSPSVLIRSGANLTIGKIATNALTGYAGDVKLSAVGDIQANHLKSGNGLINTGNYQLNGLQGSGVYIGQNGNIEMLAGGELRTGEIIAGGQASSHSGEIYLSAVQNISTGQLMTDSSNSGRDIRVHSSRGSVSIPGLSTSGHISRGNISIQANQDIYIGSQSSFQEINASGDGPGGNISLNTQNGNITLEQVNVTSEAENRGNGGNIVIRGNSFNSQSSSWDMASKVVGNGGNLDIFTDEYISIDKASISTSLEPGSSGSGGGVNLDSKKITISGKSLIDTSTFGSGDAGNIRLNAKDFIGINESLIASVTYGNGKSGSIEIKSLGDIEVSNSSSISTTSNQSALGEGGNISITGRELRLTNSSQLLTSTASSSKAGNVDINADKILISGYNQPQGNLYESKDFSTQTLSDMSIQRVSSFDYRDPRSRNTSNELSQSEIQDITSNLLSLRTDPNVVFSEFYPHISSNFSVYRVRIPQTGVRGIFKFIAGPRAGDTTSGSMYGNPPFSSSILGGDLYLLDKDFNFLTTPPFRNSIDQLDSTNRAPSLIKYTFREAGTYFLIAALSSRIDTINPVIGIGVAFVEHVLANRTRQPHEISISLGMPKLFEQKPDGTQNSGIYAQTSSSGNAGNININSSNITLANRGEIVADSSNSGTTGNITLAPTLNQNLLTINLQNGNISAATSGTSPGGNLILTAPQSISITGNGTLSAQTSGAGRAGTVEITTNQLNLDSGTNITTTATSTSTTTEPGGSITLTANQMNLLGNIAILAETQGNTPAGSLTLQPNNSNTLNINLADNSRVSASTSSTGTGGSLLITAPDTINISGPGTLSAETSGTGKAGDILIQTQNLNLSNNTQISTSTTASGQGGNLRITAPNSINLSNQAQLISQSTATGKAGNISLTSNNISLSNSKAAVNSQGNGNGGDINLTAQNLQLKQGSQLTASTASGEGGNLNLSVSDILLMRQGSRIETNAAGNGNGGDINLNNSTGFIVSVPNENSDITANAIAGNGGTINLSTSGLFGIQIRPALTSQSDITASSDSGLQGTISVSNPNVDPSKGLNELPSVPTDGSNRIDNSCSAQSNTTKSGSSFILSGRGGLPTRPGSQSNTFNTGNIRDFSPELAQQTAPIPQLDQPITEAQLSRTTPDGRVHLVAGRAVITPKPDCPESIPQT